MSATRFNNIAELFRHMLTKYMTNNTISKSGLAKKLGKDRSTITRWLNYDQEPIMDTVSYAATKLGYSVSKVDDGWVLNKPDIKNTVNDESPLNESNCGEILLNVLREIMNEASEADRAVLGPHFLEISHRLNQRLKHGQ